MGVVEPSRLRTNEGSGGLLGMEELAPVEEPFATDLSLVQPPIADINPNKTNNIEPLSPPTMLQFYVPVCHGAMCLVRHAIGSLNIILD